MSYRCNKWTQQGSKRKVDYCVRFGLGTVNKMPNWLTLRVLDQLDNCADDDARRILLGVSEQQESE